MDQFLGDRPATQDELKRNVNNAVRNLPGQYETAAEVIKSDKLTWLIVGDLSKIEQPIRDLGLGEVIVIQAQ